MAEEIAMGQVIETDEHGRLVLTAELLGDAQPRRRYTVETTGTKLLVQPEETAEQRRQAYKEWLKEWDELAEEIGKVWPASVSAVDAVSEQRR